MSQIGALFGGLFGDAGANFVDEQGGPDKVFGTKPDVAPYVSTNLSDETGKAVEGNLANFDLVTSYLNKIAPGFTDILGKGLENTFSELQGHLPGDVAEEIARNDAFKSLAGGFGGTPMGKALTARDLGLTSLNLTQLGNNSAQLWMQQAEQAYSPWTTSTSAQAAVTAANNAGKQASDQYQFNVTAAPDPGAQGVFNLDAALGQQMLSLGGAFGGAAMGGGGGGSSSGYQAPAMPGYSYQPGVGYTSNGSTQPTDWRTNATSGAWSDRRLKRDWWLVGTSETGIGIYEFEYNLPEGQASIRFLGTMADEVEEICPGAVVEIDGYMTVDYDQIDVRLQEVH